MREVRVLVAVGLARVVFIFEEEEEERVAELLDVIDRGVLARVEAEGFEVLLLLLLLLLLLGFLDEEGWGLEVGEGLLILDLGGVTLEGEGLRDFDPDEADGLGTANGFDAVGLDDDLEGAAAEGVGSVINSVTTTTSITVVGAASTTGAGGISLRLGNPRGGVFFASSSTNLAFSSGAAHSTLLSRSKTTRKRRKTKQISFDTVRISLVC